jgi:hypothetical protein
MKNNLVSIENAWTYTVFTVRDCLFRNLIYAAKLEKLHRKAADVNSKKLYWFHPFFTPYKQSYSI